MIITLNPFSCYLYPICCTPLSRSRILQLIICFAIGSECFARRGIQLLLQFSELSRAWFPGALQPPYPRLTALYQTYSQMRRIPFYLTSDSRYSPEHRPFLISYFLFLISCFFFFFPAVFSGSRRRDRSGAPSPDAGTGPPVPYHSIY